MTSVALGVMHDLFEIEHTYMHLDMWSFFKHRQSATIRTVSASYQGKQCIVPGQQMLFRHMVEAGLVSNKVDLLK